MLEKYGEYMENIDNDFTEETPKGLREQLKKEQARRKEAESQLVGLTLSELGLKRDEGLGKAVTQLYDGPIDKESISKFVSEEFNYVPNQDVSEAPVEQVTKAQQVNTSEARVQQLNQVAGHVQSTSLEDQFIDIMNTGNTKQTIAAKLAMMDNIKQQNKQ
tara:strand:- start:53 stop:535 length:483 start_codon:yes stop_codon:yes gene_type:complete